MFGEGLLEHIFYAWKINWWRLGFSTYCRKLFIIANVVLSVSLYGFLYLPQRHKSVCDLSWLYSAQAHNTHSILIELIVLWLTSCERQTIFDSFLSSPSGFVHTPFHKRKFRKLCRNYITLLQCSCFSGCMQGFNFIR